MNSKRHTKADALGGLPVVSASPFGNACRHVGGAILVPQIFSLLSCSAALTLALLADPALAQEKTSPETGVCVGDNCNTALRGKALDDSSTRDLVIGENTEAESIADKPQVPFSISVDGETVVDSARSKGDASGPEAVRTRPSGKAIDVQRKTDVGLSSVDIQVKYDGLERKTLLNVSTIPIERSYRAGDTVEFLATTNYPAFIARSEIRIYEQGRESVDKPVATIPVGVTAGSGSGSASWVMPDAPSTAEGEARDYLYVLRVYDEKDRFDETVPLTLVRTDRTDRPESRTAVAPGMAEDRTAIRNIPVNGGAITVFGRHVPPGYDVRVLGESIPLDPEQAFVVQRILPPGDHAVDVSVKGASKSGGLDFTRDVNIPNNDWFYVAMADVTVGTRTGDDHIELVRPGEYDTVYNKGRAAFYLKGKIKGEYLLTAAADTREDDLDKVFRNLDSRDARQLLRRLDPDDYYPVYGDDSTVVEDAPTSGKFYVRLERGDSYVMWGNSKVSITGTEFMRSDRALYGAHGEYNSEETTSFGERRTQVATYAALPDTLPQRDEFLGTGGSAYFLKRQDITVGSETVMVEVRDPISGRIVQRRTLSYGEDYSFDYLQGVVILRRPLSSSGSASGAVRDGALGGDNQFLVVQYEFVPAAADTDGYVFGGRAQHWIDDRIRIGFTGIDESTGDARTGEGANLRALGADVQLRYSETTFLEGEYSHSRGAAFGTTYSYDGGVGPYSLADSTFAGGTDRTGDAWRVRGQVDLADIAPKGNIKGTVGGYYEQRDAGFATLTEQAGVDRRLYGVNANLDLGHGITADASYDGFEDGDDQSQQEAAANVAWQVDRYWKAKFGLTYTELMSPYASSISKSGYNGHRVDGGARLEYRWDDDHMVYVFGQGTLSRKGDIYRNDRIGVGAEVQLTDTIGAEAEISYGTHGLGGLAALTYEPTADASYYLGYRLDPSRAFDISGSMAGANLTGTDAGSLVVGVKRRMSDTASAYAESNYDMFGRRRSLAQTYGVVYTPDAQWTIDGGLEAGRIRDHTLVNGVEGEDFDRTAVSLSVGYTDDDEGLSARMRGEVRVEDGVDDSRDQNTYLFAAGMTWKTDPNWRLLANVDAVLSDADTSANTLVPYQDTDYVEASVGYAYRPVEDDRLNALFKYTWLYNLPGNNQIVSGDDEDQYAVAQRSHILSADFTYDVTPWLSAGAKYGFRYGQIRERLDDGTSTAFGNWETSSAHLGIIRADLHIVKNWDALVEGRVMAMPEADTIDWGALVAVYRHVGNNFKVGVGYNFGVFSDDLRDLTLNDEGVFFNVVGKI